MFPCGSRSGASVVFSYFVHRAESPRTLCLLATVSHPAGPQVAKYTLFLFVWFARSILALSPSAKQIPYIVMRGEQQIKEREKETFGRHYSAWSSPASGGSDRMFEFCLSADDDNVPGLHLCPAPLILRGGHAGKDKQQQGAPSFP